MAREMGDENVLVVKDVPHFAPYLQFLVNIIQIHFEHVRQGNPDYNIAQAISVDDLNSLSAYLNRLQDGEPVQISQRFGRLLYATGVVISRMLISDYGEEICGRLISRLPSRHRWHRFEDFRTDMLRHNAQLLMDIDSGMSTPVDGLAAVRKQLNEVTV